MLLNKILGLVVGIFFGVVGWFFLTKPKETWHVFTQGQQPKLNPDDPKTKFVAKLLGISFILISIIFLSTSFFAIH